MMMMMMLNDGVDDDGDDGVNDDIDDDVNDVFDYKDDLRMGSRIPRCSNNSIMISFKITYSSSVIPLLKV